MAKDKEPKEMKTSELLDHIYQKDEWDDGIYEEIISRLPFDEIKENRAEMQKKIDELKKEVYELQKHSHSDGKVVTPVI